MENSFIDFKIFAVPAPAPDELLQEEGNRRNVMVVIEAPGPAPELRDFLDKVLGAAQVDTRADIVLLRLAPGGSLLLGPWLRRYRSRKVVLFGLAPARLGLHFPLPLYRIRRHAGVDYLAADPLEAVHAERQRGEKEKASLLWQALKELFPPDEQPSTSLQ